MSQNGWISLHRKIQDCWIWEEKPYDRARAWIDLLLLMVHSDTKISVKGDFVEVSRGQYLISIRNLADRWGWSKDKVSKFLAVLEKDGMIEKTIVKNRTLLTVVNYDFYQGQQDKNRTENGQTSDAHRTQNNNVNKGNNINKHLYGDFFERCWQAYPRKRGKGSVSDNQKRKLFNEVGEEQMMRCIERYKDSCVGKDEQYVMYGSTFFNSGYVDFLDENVDTPKPKGGDSKWQTV